jgi:lysozyme
MGLRSRGAETGVNLKLMLKRDEGIVRHAYQDSLGYWTIGVGRLIDKRKGGGLSDAEIDYLLENDVREVCADVLEALPWVIRMNEARQAVVYAMCFQMGLKGLLGFRSTLDSMRDERYANAAEGMRQSKWAKQTPERANRMAYQLEVGEWQ